MGIRGMRRLLGVKQGLELINSFPEFFRATKNNKQRYSPPDSMI